MKQIYKQLGKVRPTVEGDWSIDKNYTLLSIVYDEVGNASYISRKDVPAGIQITNKEYWTRFSNTRVNSDSIVLLSKIQDDGLINSYDLQEAIDSFKIEDRRLGTFISFYEKPIGESTDYRWNLYQFNSNNIDDWNNTKYWQSIYYIQNKFLGLFSSEESLKRTRPFPIIGDYAFVGATLKEAVVYRCNNIGVWTRTNEKAKDYLSINLKGDITISEEGNWVIDGVDTGISSKGEDGKTPLLRIKDYKWQVSYDGGTIYKDIPNSPIFVKEDDEDIVGNLQTDGVKLLKFADKEYNTSKFSGLGRVYLRKNIVNGKNILTQEMINKSNTIYIIQYNYDLDNKEINIPNNCTLQFEGGSFKNGSLNGNNTKINNSKNIFYNIELIRGFISNLYYKMFINNTNTPLEEYKILRKYIKFCFDNNVNPTFKDIKSLIIQFDGTPIILPEGEILDFDNINIEVIDNNATGDLIHVESKFSFKEITDSSQISLLKSKIDNFNTIELPFIDEEKTYILTVEDKNVWTDREGYDYNHIRKDIILINRCKTYNTVISTYNNGDISNPVFLYKEVLNKKTVLKNLNFKRSDLNKKIIYLIRVNGINNLDIININANTNNKSNLSGDSMIIINNSTNVTIKNCTIDGTYDYQGYGYAFNLNNIYNFIFENNNTYNNNWGIFGNNNLNRATLNNCNINRFDIHCYGKDITFNNCGFYYVYNQYSSIYGFVVYNNCIFNSHIPCLIESSYNAYTPFNLIYNKCIFTDVNRFYSEYNNDVINNREELKNKALPNISIYDCVINNTIQNFRIYILYNSGGGNTIERTNINNITIKGFKKLKQNNFIFHFAYKDIITKNNLNINIDNLNLATIEEYTKPITEKYKYDNSIKYDKINKDVDKIIFLNIYNSTFCICPDNINQNVSLNIYNSNIYDFRSNSRNNNLYDTYNNCIIHLTNIDDLELNVFSIRKNSIFNNCVFNNNYNNTYMQITIRPVIFKNCIKTDNTKRVYNLSYINDELELNNLICGNDYILDKSYRYIRVSDEANILSDELIKTNNVKVINKMFESNRNAPAYLCNSELTKKYYMINDSLVIKKGTTAQRPTGVQIGFTYKDTDLNKWIIWNGRTWENIDGTALG